MEFCQSGKVATLTLLLALRWLLVSFTWEALQLRQQDYFASALILVISANEVCMRVTGFPPIWENCENFFQLGKSGENGFFQPKSGKKCSNQGNFPTVGG